MEPLKLFFTISHRHHGRYSLEEVSIPCNVLGRQDSGTHITEDLMQLWTRLCQSRCCTTRHELITIARNEVKLALMDYAQLNKDTRAPSMEPFFQGAVFDVITEIISLMADMASAYVPEPIGRATIQWIMTLNPFPSNDDTVRWIKTRTNARPFIVHDTSSEWNIITRGVFGVDEIPLMYWKHHVFREQFVYDPLSRDSSARMDFASRTVHDAIEDAARYVTPLTRSSHSVYIPFLNPYIIMGILISENMQNFLSVHRIVHSIAALQLYTTELLLNFAANWKNYNANFLNGYMGTSFWSAACHPPKLSADALGLYSLKRINALYQKDFQIKF